MYKAIGHQFAEEDFESPADRPLTLAAYDAGPPPASYIDLVWEETYQAAWQHFAGPMK